jgi:hypothetical protein
MGKKNEIGWWVYNPRGMVRATLRVYDIPKEWIDELKKAKASIPEVMQPSEPWVASKEDAVRICREYLKIRDKNWWPALLGKSEIMDEVLAEEFKNRGDLCLNGMSGQGKTSKKP